MDYAKGASILVRLDFVKWRYGDQCVWELLDRVSPEHRDLVMKGISPSAWIPHEFYIELNVCADLLFGHGDLSLCYAMGRYAASVNIPAFFHMFLRIGNPRFAMRRADRVFRAQFSTGRLTVHDSGDRATFRIEDVAQPHRAQCLSALGWIARGIEMTGSTLEEAYEISCRVKGAPSCQLYLEWS